MEACAKDEFLAIETFCSVRDKSGKRVPQRLYGHHKKYFKHSKNISFVLKARQVWFTTTLIGRFMYRCNIKEGYRGIFVNLDRKKTEAVFKRARYIHDQWPTQLKQKLTKDTSDEMEFSGTGATFTAFTCKNDSGAASASEFGRSLTATDVHISEGAYITYLKEILAGIMGSRPKTGGNYSVIIESTGNGTQGEYYTRCMAIHDNGTEVAPNVWHYGDQSFHFIPWFEHYQEYNLAKDPFESVEIPYNSKKLWMENEIIHRMEMDKYDDMDIIDKERAMNFLRYIALNEYNLATEPEYCIRITNQEYPATMDQAFQSTSGAFLSLTRTKFLHDKWKDENVFGEMGPLPIYGRLTNTGDHKYQFMPDSNGEIMLWETPIHGWTDRYLVGGDCGHGLSDGDRDAVFVLDRVKNKVVAVAHGTFGPQKAAQIYQALGYFFGTAKVAPENNDPGVGVIIKLREFEYPNLFKWRPDGDDNKSFGFLTLENSRKEGLAILKNEYHKLIGGFEVPYLEFYTEAKAFQIPPGSRKQKPEGVGCHDDLILGGMIVCAVSSIMPKPEKIEDEYELKPGTVGHYIRSAVNNMERTPVGMRNM